MINIESDPGDAVASRYFKNINSFAGSLTIGVGLAIIKFEAASEWAWGTLLITLIWAMFQGEEYRKLQKLRPNYPAPWGLFFKNCIPFLAGWILLSCIALDVFNKFT
jgi:hypothetical protein